MKDLMTKARQLVEKLQRVESRIAEERGPFNLFALFLRDGAPIGWDVVISAPWAHMDRETLDYVIGLMREELDQDYMVMVARVVVLEPDWDEIQELAQEHPVEHGQVLIHYRDFGLQTIRKGYIITARPFVAEAA